MVETGKVCGLANGSCWIHYGETVVMVNVTASPKPREGVDFFPLAVDYEEKLYAVGKIPGGYLKREGRPSEKAILTSRVVDRPMRPLFPKDMRNDVAIVMTVLAVDPETQPEILSMIGASIAVSISDIPWNGPIGGISVGLVDGVESSGTIDTIHFACVVGCHEEERAHQVGNRRHATVDDAHLSEHVAVHTVVDEATIDLFADRVVG